MTDGSGPANPFVGQVFAVAGTLTRRTQAEIRIGVEVRGGTFRTGLSKKTSFLVAGNKAKLEKAEALGVTVLNEDEFEEMLARVPVTAEMRARYLA